MSVIGTLRYDSIAVNESHSPTYITARGFMFSSTRSRWAKRRRRSWLLTYRKSSSLVSSAALSAVRFTIAWFLRSVRSITGEPNFVFVFLFRRFESHATLY